MTLPGVVGSADPAKMFIPEWWANKTVEALMTTTSFEYIGNQDYSGEIKKHGDTVNIDYDPIPPVHEYARGQNLVFDHMETNSTQLLIDKGLYFAGDVESVIAYQTQDNGNRMKTWTYNGGRAVGIAIDKQIINDIPVDADPLNTGLTAGKVYSNINLGVTGTPFALTAANILDKLSEMAEIMDQQDVDEQNRWVLLPSWAATMLEKSDIRNASFSADGGDVLTNGMVTKRKYAGFTVFKTNQYTPVVDGLFSAYNILFGHTSALTWGKQIEDVQNDNNPHGFGQLLKTLCVYGYKVVQPKALGVLYAYAA